MAESKPTGALLSDDRVVLQHPLETERDWSKFSLHLQDVIVSTLNANDSGTNNFSDADVIKLADLTRPTPQDPPPTLLAIEGWNFYFDKNHYTKLLCDKAGQQKTSAKKGEKVQQPL